tara:strand:- start:1914 stop:2585 length:672 start_codon:yes stop_codon:yes gene_type:complete
MTQFSLTLKLATSLDGRIALANGASQWITGTESREHVHQLRASSDAVLTGIGTVLADDPLMTSRPGGVESQSQPVRVVLDTHLRMPETARMLTGDAGLVMVFCRGDVPAYSQDRLREAGAEVVGLNRFDGPSVAFRSVVEALRERDLNALMVEAGSRLAGSALRSGLVTRIEWFRAPTVLGGDGRPCFDTMGFERLDEAPIFERERVAPCGADLHETYVRKEG